MRSVALAFAFAAACFSAAPCLAEQKGEKPSSAQQAPAPAVLDKARVIEMAKKKAKSEGINLSAYKKVKATFDPARRSWDVSFMMDPAPPGGFFDVIIDDRSGTSVLVRGE